MDRHIFGRYWQGLDSPRHLAIYSRDTIKLALERAGFEIVRFRTGTGSYFVYLLSFRLWVSEAVGNPLFRRALLAVGGSWPVRLDLSPVLAIVDALGRGSEMMIAAQPRRQPARKKDE
jgi:hypothetical protein